MDPLTAFVMAFASALGKHLADELRALLGRLFPSKRPAAEEASAGGTTRPAPKLIKSGGAGVQQVLLGAYQGVQSRIAERAQLPVDIYASGAHNADRIAVFDPDDPGDDGLEIGGPVDAPGGSAANTAVAGARLRLKTETSGIVANDPAGDLLVSSLSADRVGVGDIVISPSSDLWSRGTGVAHINEEVAGPHRRTIKPGINEEWAIRLTGAERAGLLEAMRRTKVLVLSSMAGDAQHRLQGELAHADPGLVVALVVDEINGRQGIEKISALVERADIVVAYRKELARALGGEKTIPARSVAKKLLAWRRARGVERALLLLLLERPRLGRLGQPTRLTLFAGQGVLEEEIHPTPEVSRAAARFAVVDRTGLADAALAGLVFALLTRRTAQEAADLTALMGAYVMTKVGARDGLPSRQALMRRYNSIQRRPPSPGAGSRVEDLRGILRAAVGIGRAHSATSA